MKKNILICILNLFLLTIVIGEDDNDLIERFNVEDDDDELEEEEEEIVEEKNNKKKTADKKVKKINVDGITIDLGQISNHGISDFIQKFCKDKNIKTKQIESKLFKIITVGGLQLTQSKLLLSLGDKVLNNLDKWTGSQKIFNKVLKVDSKYCLVLFKNGSDFNNFLDYFTKNTTFKANALAKQLGNFVTTKFDLSVYTPTRAKIIENVVVSSVSKMATQSIFKSLGSHGTKFFFTEGISSNMQYDLCNKKVLCYTISYEMNKLSKDEINKSWAESVKTIIKDKDNNIRRDAYFLMEIDLVKNTMADYQQLWSLSRYVILRSKKKKGDQNKLFNLIKESANNKRITDMVKNAFNLKVATLTKNWYRWAYAQR
ncbi:MAG: hypothetical protein COA79_17000 [Planctomycetota bacterium]|nr:MAG: hypothetical protein COA79_17000 [Planctomycetota bacterium]